MLTAQAQDKAGQLNDAPAGKAPTRVMLAYEYCRSRSGLIPFGAGMTAEFTMQKASGGTLLRITQSGFPSTPLMISP